MNLNRYLLVCWLGFPLALCGAAYAGAEKPPVEIRALNIHPSWYWKQENVSERREAMLEFLDMTERANINLLRMWIESCHIAALFGEPAYKDLEWNRTSLWNTSEWDMVRELIDAAQKREMEVHFWYSFTRYKRDRNHVPEYDPNLKILPPGNPDWASVKKSEYLAGHTNPADPQVTGTALCNNETAAHRWTMRVIEMVFERYPELTGFHIEEPGYLDLERCVCHRCQQVYHQLYGEPGEDLLDHIHTDWREYGNDPKAIAVKTAGTNGFVFNLVDWMNRRFPDKIISTGGGTRVLSERARGRNWYQWTHWGLIRYWGNQAYRNNLEAFENIVKGAMEGLEGSGADFIPIVSIKSTRIENPPELVVQQIEKARELDGYRGVKVSGVGLFSGLGLTPAHAEALREGPFQQPATLPWRN